MKLLLPSSDYSYLGGLASVSSNTLVIQRCCDYYSIMYDASYSIYGRDHCYYCGAKFVEDDTQIEQLRKNNPGKSFLSMKKITLDHRFPTSVGGITITNNLIPCCKQCNNLKSFLTEEEFNFYRKLSKSEGKEYRRDVERYKRHFQYKWDTIIPQKWVTYVSIDKIKLNINLFNVPIHRSYAKVAEHYALYGRILKPIVVDANFFLLDGLTRIIFAKKNSIKTVPVTVLENVLYMPNRS